MIQVLDQHTIDKIAAGEVVERPASVVKELIENAIDSMANAITVEIKDGGISLIRITDNGCGIAAGEVETAFLRHATSKIRTIEDLLTTSSLGFRGEALSSIASVAQVEVITKPADALTGIRYRIEGGKEQSKEEIGCPDGTTFLIRNLFYNTPARRKFLKTAMTEAGYVVELVEEMALSRPDISFKLVVNGQNKLTTSGNGSRKDIIYHIYGRDISANLLPIDAKQDGLHVEGYVAKPYVSRGNRGFEHYFVNGRYIKNPVITKAIEEAYKTFVMIHKFPFVVLDLTVDAKLLDVNVHPRKMEMRYEKSEELYRFLFDEIRAVLLQSERIPEIHETAPQPKPQAPSRTETGPEPFETRRKSQIQNQTIPLSIGEDTHDHLRISAVREPVNPPADEAGSQQMSFLSSGFMTEEARPRHRLIGQLFRTYWLIEYEENLFIMDQHAAHEKVMFEKLMEQYQTRNIYAQELNPPLIISVTPRQIELLQDYQALFSELGFRLESFGGKEYMLRAVPLETYGLAAQDIFVDLIDSLAEDGNSPDIDRFIYRVASMSCKAAVKGGMELSMREAQALLDQLMQLENPYNCPHGRPTIITMSKAELERKFQRIQDRSGRNTDRGFANETEMDL